VVTTLRQRLTRALLATLMLSRGVPMLLGGDELGRTQRGNNNAYALDCEVSWYDWARADSALRDFTAQLVGLRRATPQLASDRWLTGMADAEGRRDLVWLDRHGHEMQSHHWEEVNRFVLGMLLGALPAQAGRPAAKPLLALFNAEHNDWAFPLPAGRWRLRFDSALPEPFAVDGTSVESAELVQKARSVVVLEQDTGQG
jgi:pullulanase/glycogen debranching enzyme